MQHGLCKEKREESERGRVKEEREGLRRA